MRITLAVAILPALGLLFLFKKWDEKRPEPPGMIRNAVIFGALSCIPAAIIELVLMAVLGEAVVNAQGGLVNGVVVAAMTEEALKLSVVMLFFYRRQEFNETMDGILYTAAASLGFALLENVLYAGGNLVVGLARAISAVPLHATASGLMGYFVGVAKMRGGAFSRISLGYFVAVLIHGVYDWAVFSGGRFGFGTAEPLLGFALAVGIVIVAAIALRVAVKRALAADDEALGHHARPVAVVVPQVWPQAQPHAVYGYGAPAPYGMHQPYAGHVPAPQAQHGGWHQPVPHQYAHAQPHAHAHAPHAQPHQQNPPYAPPQQAGGAYAQQPAPYAQQQPAPPVQQQPYPQQGHAQPAPQPPAQPQPGWGRPPQGWNGQGG
ncbi:MAG: PrsW family intramembrane metalloprotease [Myxococcales bacterium]|nr:PrsW family intramembrane metalloprotease [Myxococcales bacterium]